MKDTKQVLGSMSTTRTIEREDGQRADSPNTTIGMCKNVRGHLIFALHFAPPRSFVTACAADRLRVQVYQLASKRHARR